jgi:hypothetical protein
LRLRLFLSMLASFGVVCGAVSAGPSDAFAVARSSSLATRTLVIQGERGESHIVAMGHLEARIGTGRLIAKASSSLKVFRFQRIRDLPAAPLTFASTD